jgi:hypothetical protein
MTHAKHTTPCRLNVVQELPLSGGELDDGAPSGGEGRIPLWRIVSPLGVRRDQPHTAASRAVVRFYNKRGTTEQWIKEGKQAVKMTRLSCHRFQANEVRLWLSLIAYNLGNLWRRRLVLPAQIGNWSAAP